MIPYLGDFLEDATVYMMFNTFTSNDPSASCTITDFINTDVHIHKDDSDTQRNNAAGITVSTNFDTITGSHMIKIDTSDDTVGGFWVTGSDYFVRIEGTTVDGAVINAVVGHFSIENRFKEVTVTSMAANVITATSINANAITEAKIADNAIAGEHLNATACTKIIDDFETQSQADPTGFHVNVKEVNGTAQTANDMSGDIDDILTDTNTLETDWKDGGRLDLIQDIIAADTTTDIPGTITTMQGNVDDILADTDELQAEWADGGRSDLILDIIAADTTTDIPGTITTMQGNVDDILADTNELQAEWVDGGRLDLILDIIAADTTTDIPALINALDDITVAEIIAGIADGSNDLQEMLRIIYSVVAGKSSGGGTATIKFRDSGDAKDRVTATVDADGNRTGMVVDGS